MLSKREAADQVIRFERTIGYPQDVGALRRLRDGLLAACSRHHVSPASVVDRCLQMLKFCPTDAHFFEFAQAVREEMHPTSGVPLWSPPPPPQCAKCCGTGWAIVKRGDLSGVKRCGCGVAVRSQFEDGKASVGQ